MDALPPERAARPGVRKFRRKEPDFNQVTLVGTIARPPLRVGEFLERTLAGKVKMLSDKVLPYCHKVRVRAGMIERAFWVAGHVVRVDGWFKHHKFGTKEEPRSIIRVGAELLQVNPAPFEVRTVPRREWQELSFLLNGGKNMVLLAGHLIRPAEQFTRQLGIPTCDWTWPCGPAGVERKRATIRTSGWSESALEATDHFSLKD